MNLHCVLQTRENGREKGGGRGEKEEGRGGGIMNCLALEATSGATLVISVSVCVCVCVWGRGLQMGRQAHCAYGCKVSGS